MARGKKKETLTPEERLQAALVPESEQPYKVPENWCWTRLGQLYQINPKNVADDFTDAAFIPMEKIAAGFVNEYSFEIQPWSKAKKGHTQFADGDVAFAKISPCFENRKSMLLNGLPNGIGGGTTELVILRQAYMHPKYTFWFVSQEQFIRGGVATYSGTVGQQRISMDYVRTYPIPVPPFAEQQRIVDRIESLFAKLDEAKQKAQEALDSFETRKAAILHKAFTGELTAQWRKEHGVRMESWESKLLKNIVVTVKDKFDPATQTTSLHYIGLEHIQKNQGIIGFGTADDIKSLKTIFKRGDILYGKLRPYLNKHDIARFDGICSTDILVYRTKYSQTAKYINYFMNTERFISTAVSNSKGINLPRVSEKEIGNIPVNIPHISEQTEIVRILDDLLAKEQQAKEAAEGVLEQVDLIKKAILARAFRGQLGTNDPSEESAVELLKQTL